MLTGAPSIAPSERVRITARLTCSEGGGAVRIVKQSAREDDRAPHHDELAIGLLDRIHLVQLRELTKRALPGKPRVANDSFRIVLLRPKLRGASDLEHRLFVSGGNRDDLTRDDGALLPR